MQAIIYIPITLSKRDACSVRAGTRALSKLEAFIHDYRMQQDTLESEGKAIDKNSTSPLQDLPSSSVSYQVEQVSSRYRRNDWEVHERGLWACDVWSRIKQVVLILPVQKWAALLKLEGLKLKIQQREIALSTTGRRAVGLLPRDVVDMRHVYRFKKSALQRNILRVTKNTETISGSGSS